MDPTTLAGIIYALAAAFLWSLIAPLSKNCLAAGVSALEVAFWRAFFGCLFFALHTAFQGGLRIPLKNALIFTAFGAWGMGVMFGALQVSIQLSGAAMAMVLLFTAPSWVAVLSRIVFNESISRTKLAALALALAGTIFVCLSGGSLGSGYSLLGIGCGLLAGFGYASQFPFYVWWSKRFSTGVIYTYMLIGGTLTLLPFSPFAPGKSLYAWANLVALGVLTNFMAYILFGLALRRINQVQAAVIGNVEPVLATLLVWLFYGENFTAMGWAGSLLIIGAVFLLTFEKAVARRTA